MVQSGDVIDVVILDFDENSHKLSLGHKQLTPNPWDELEAKYPVGTVVDATVSVIGDKNTTLTLDREARKMSLGIKQLTANPWESIREKYPVGSQHKATVRNIEQVHNRAFSPALSDFEGASYTYADLAVKMATLHAFFREAGIQKGDKISLVARNSARWAIFFLAANTYEAVIVPILPNFTPEGAMQLIHHSDSVLLIADADIWKSMDKDKLPHIKGVLNAREDGLLYGTPEMQQAWERHIGVFNATYPDGLDPQKVEYHDHMDQLAIINYTSGTSGDPKGVMLSFGAMSDIVEYCQQHITDQPEAIVSMLPLAHIYGLAMEFVYPCCTGYQICARVRSFWTRSYTGWPVSMSWLPMAMAS